MIDDFDIVETRDHSLDSQIDMIIRSFPFDEVKRIFDVTKNIKHKAILMTIYGGGLRLAEAAHLKIEDINEDI